MVGSHARGELSRAWSRTPGVATEAHGTSWSRVEAGRQRVGWADERRGLLQHGSGLKEPGLMLEGRRLAVQGRCGWECGPQEGRGLVDGGGRRA